MNIIYNNSDESNVCSVLNKIDQCLIKGNFRGLNDNYSNDWLPKNEKHRLEWANANYNISINYQANYDSGIKASIKRLIKRIIHKLIKFNLISICLQQTEYNAQIIRIQNQQYNLFGQLSLEIEELRVENKALKERLDYCLNK